MLRKETSNFRSVSRDKYYYLKVRVLCNLSYRINDFNKLLASVHITQNTILRIIMLIPSILDIKILIKKELNK